MIELKQSDVNANCLGTPIFYLKNVNDMFYNISFLTVETIFKVLSIR